MIGETPVAILNQTLITPDGTAQKSSPSDSQTDGTPDETSEDPAAVEDGQSPQNKTNSEDDPFELSDEEK